MTGFRIDAHGGIALGSAHSRDSVAWGEVDRALRRRIRAAVVSLSTEWIVAMESSMPPTLFAANLDTAAMAGFIGALGEGACRHQDV